MSRRQKVWIAVLLLWLLFAQTMASSRRLSLTYDEPIYTAIGYADLTTGDVRWHGVIGHPPLVNLLTAWPLLLDSDRPDARQVPGWGTEDSLGFSRAMIARLGSLERVTLVTRIPVIWLALLLAAFVYRWAQQTWGGMAGVLAVGVFVFDPHIVAHSQLNTTDMGVTAFGFMGCYALARYLRHPSRGAYLGAGLGMGAALASKASGPFWMGAFVLVAFVSWLRERPANRIRRAGRWTVALIGWGGLALFVLWAAYLFELRPLSPGGLPIPAASHWAGLPYIRSYMATGQITFLAGQLVPGGHWSYFPLALLVKTPLPTLIGLCAATVWFLPRRKLNWSTIPLIFVPVSYLAVAMGMALNIGHRHMLTLFPFTSVFIALLAGQQGPLQNHAATGKRLVFGLVMIWYIVGTVTVFPHYLSYFNELAGGPDGGYRYLADSSVDWGQGFKTLKRYLDRREQKSPVDEIYLAAFSSLDPTLYGLSFTPIPPTLGAPITLTARFNPEPGTYVISAVPLQGIWLLDPDTYDWFRHRQPTDQVGHALLVYDVPPDLTPTWVNQCTDPLPILDTDQVAAGFGRSDLRLTVFDCQRSWLYPIGASGWTVLPGTEDPDAWMSERLKGASLSFRQDELWSHPALSIYRQRSRPEGSVPPHTTLYIGPSDWLPGDLVERGAKVQAPVNVAGQLTFLGYDVHPDVGEVELHTYWQVEQTPNRLLSLMAHLVTEDGILVATGDGLGVPIEVWRPGDIIVQRHILNLPQGDPPRSYYLLTGVYWLDTLERWPIVFGGNAEGDRLLLPWPRQSSQ